MTNHDEIRLHQIQRRIIIEEDAGSIAVDISGENGGPGIRLLLSVMLAGQLGRTLCDRARFMGAKASDDPERLKIDEFDTSSPMPHIGWQLWPSQILTEETAKNLKCGHEGCSNGIGHSGGLKNIAPGDNVPKWRCSEHREAADYDAYRNDINDAHKRAHNTATLELLMSIAEGRLSLDEAIKNTKSAKIAEPARTSD